MYINTFQVELHVPITIKLHIIIITIDKVITILFSCHCECEQKVLPSIWYHHVQEMIWINTIIASRAGIG